MIQFLINLVSGIIFLSIFYSVIRKAFSIIISRHIEALPVSYGVRIPYVVADTGSPLPLFYYWGEKE